MVQVEHVPGPGWASPLSQVQFIWGPFWVSGAYFGGLPLTSNKINLQNNPEARPGNVSLVAISV